MAIPQLSPAQRRKEAQRERIIAEAVKLFQENGGEAAGGFDGTTIEAIAERADISVRTFFRYFDSKADVIYLDTRRSLADFRANILNRMETDPPLLAIVNAGVEGHSIFISNPVNRVRMHLALTSKNWTDRRALFNMQRRELAVEMLQPFCGSDAVGYQKAYFAAILALSVNDSVLATWARFPRASLDQLTKDALKGFKPILDEYEFDKPAATRTRRAARG